MPKGATRIGRDLFIQSLLVFTGSDLRPLHSEQAQLLGGTIDGGAMLIQQIFSGSSLSSCAVFPNYSWQAFVGRKDNIMLWKLANRTQYWAKDVWVVPIHYQNDHWYLGIIKLSQAQVHIFDSIYWSSSIAQRGKVSVS